MRIFITAGSSYVGQHLVPAARTAGHTIAHTYYRHDLGGDGRQLDVRDGDRVRAEIEAFRPEVIIHLAGSNRGTQMTAVIEQGTENVSRAATAVGARLIHMSTDVIFDGREAPYKESDPPRPLHAYGRAKANAERIVAATAENYVIVRPSLIYGLQKMDRSCEWITNALAAGETVTLFTDQYRSPVWVRSLVAACLELSALPYTGILHVAGSQRLSRSELGERLLRWWGIGDWSHLRRAPMPPDGRWPLDTTLNIALAERVLSGSLLGVDDVLALAA